MVDKITIYSDYSSIEEIALFDAEYPRLNKIIKSHSVFKLNISEDEMSKKWNDENDLFLFCLGNDIETPISDPDFFVNLKNDYSIGLSNPRAIYIIDENDEKVEEIKNSFGIVVISKNNIPDDVLQLKFKKHLNKGDVINGESHGWKNMLKNTQLLPSNSVVLTDNHLFSNEQNGKLVGQDNLVNLLDAIMPATFNDIYQILVICKPPNKSDEWINRLIGNIKSAIKSRKKYNIKLEFVFTNTIHERYLFSNYYTIECGKGFKLFNIADDKTVFDNNKVNVMSNFQDIDTLEDGSDSDHKLATKELLRLKKKHQELKLQINAGIDTGGESIKGDCENDKSINNRLLNSI